MRTLEVRQGVKICCPEEIAFDHGFIGAAELEALAERFGKSAYGQYLRSILAERRDTSGVDCRRAPAPKGPDRARNPKKSNHDQRS